MLDENINNITNPWVVDASFTAPLFLREETSSTIQGFFNVALQKKHHIILPTLWWYEINSIFTVSIIRQRLNLQEVKNIIEILNCFNFQIEPIKFTTSIFNLAHQHNLSAYDATYLDLALRHKAALASLDKQLNTAAQKLGIETWR